MKLYMKMELLTNVIGLNYEYNLKLNYVIIFIYRVAIN